MGTLGDARPRPFGVIVVNYGSSRLIAENLRPLDRIGDACTVVVVDNWSDADERDRVVTLGRERGWTVVTPDGNTGFGAGVNAGAAAARLAGARDFLLLNPDARIEPAGVEALAEAAKGDALAVYAPVIRRPDGRVWFDGLWLDAANGAMRGVTDPPARGHLWLTGACLWIPGEAWDRIGGFDPSYFLYWEDVDFSRRALDAGCSLHVVHEATAVHDVGGTQTRRGTAKSPTYYYYTIRNRALYAAKHLTVGDIRRWREDDVRQAWTIILRGGRRQLLTPLRPLSAMIRGLRSGRKLTAAALRRRVTRVYISARTAHLERDSDRRHVTLLYAERRYDFDPAAAGVLDVESASAAAVFRHLLRHPTAVLEVNEPLFLRAVFRSLAALAAVELRRVAGRGRTVVVTYCIENLDPRESLRNASPIARIKGGVKLILSSWVWRRIDRAVFGTPGARDLYGALLSRSRRGAEMRTIPALPARTPPSARRASPPTVVFLGAFVPRKGYRDVLAAWPGVVRAHPDARLIMMGKGEGEADVRTSMNAGDRISLLVDPPRPEIFTTLAEASVLVLPSKRQKAWREQVGLPIVEGLGAGCEIVTTAETGLAEWLRSHHHRVIDSGTPDALASAIVDALRNARSQEDILADLPEMDGRQEADRWLTRVP